MVGVTGAIWFTASASGPAEEAEWPSWGWDLGCDARQFSPGRMWPCWTFFWMGSKKPAKYIVIFYIFSTYFVRDIGISPDILRYPLLISNGSFHFGLALECRWGARRSSPGAYEATSGCGACPESIRAMFLGIVVGTHMCKYTWHSAYITISNI